MLRFIVFLFAASNTGCSVGDQFCSAVGCRSGLEVDIELTKSLPPTIIIEACVDSTCHSTTVPSARVNDTSVLPYDGHSITVTSTLVTGGTPQLKTNFDIANGDRLLDGTTFGVTIRDGTTGALIAGSETAPVQWQITQPNGASCEPTCETPKNLTVNHITP